MKGPAPGLAPYKIMTDLDSRSPKLYGSFCSGSTTLPYNMLVHCSLMSNEIYVYLSGKRKDDAIVIFLVAMPD